MSHIEILKYTKILVGVVLLASSAVHASTNQCRDLFSVNAIFSKESEIIDRIENLAKMYLQIETKDMAPENIAQSTAHLNRDLALLVKINPDSIRLFKEKVAEFRAKIYLEVRERNEQREVHLKERAIQAQAINFHDISPGKFDMVQPQEESIVKSFRLVEDSKKYVEKKITKKFAMMEMLMTQLTWAKLQIAMGETDLKKIDPSYFDFGKESKEVIIQGISVKIRPDHPVESVDFYAVKDFIKKLNILSKSDDFQVQTLLETMFNGHKKGDIYDLPSEAQWEFVMSNRGNTKEKYFDRDEPDLINDYAWTIENSGEETNIVGALRPRVIQGKPFYDLEGNVSEWTKDWYDETKKNEQNAYGERYTGKAIRGGSYASSAKSLESGYRACRSAEACSAHIGFRLVRIRP